MFTAYSQQSLERYILLCYDTSSSEMSKKILKERRSKNVKTTFLLVSLAASIYEIASGFKTSRAILRQLGVNI